MTSKCETPINFGARIDPGLPHFKCHTKPPTPRQANLFIARGPWCSMENMIDVLIPGISFNEHVLLRQNKRKHKGSTGKLHIPHSEWGLRQLLSLHGEGSSSLRLGGRPYWIISGFRKTSLPTLSQWALTKLCSEQNGLIPTNRFIIFRAHIPPGLCWGFKRAKVTDLTTTRKECSRAVGT